MQFRHQREQQLGQAQLQQLILAYREKHPERVGEGEMDLAAIVAEMSGQE